ncbi:hypothetical protein NEOLI_004253 [Neolecta irregularis DAH-3]|uniref:Uncharacterized protein n=1 Tax=Neolecta irregularis (strain DAH-3) TaxID=1198029 RepID=A0A1U7LTT4_NEOID|nr:hypothetical protein NEOLI_004253 [Neolecta irregularis DAH-3]|eukprot:OLL26039.1 hypothetical protein NEOLI_004253 [Neolecta irregularis DAH-3]
MYRTALRYNNPVYRSWDSMFIQDNWFETDTLDDQRPANSKVRYRSLIVFNYIIRPRDSFKITKAYQMPVIANGNLNHSNVALFVICSIFMRIPRVSNLSSKLEIRRDNIMVMNDTKL